MTQIIKTNWASLALIILSAGIGIFMSHSLPAQIPVHFSISGQPDNFASKTFALSFLPSLAFLVVFFVSGLIKLSPSNFAASQSAPAIARLNFAIVAFLMTIYLASLREALEPGEWIHKAVPFGLSILTIFMGNYFGKIEQNFVVGFRLPWTLASTDNWKQTHRFAGKMHVIAGAVSLAWVLVQPHTLIPIAALIIATASTIVFSYRF
jgi:uncharacterized membrane protein